jgi:hypothetical protein
MQRQPVVWWKQIDKFESNVEEYGETKATWRGNFTAKGVDIERLKAGAFCGCNLR